MINFKRKNRGFTLVELLTIIMLLGILAALLMPNFRRAFAKAQLTDCMTNQKQFATMIQIYYVEAKKFPEPDETDCLPFSKLTPYYTNNKPKTHCPVTDLSYIYVTDDMCDNFTIMCRESDGGSSHPKMGITVLYPRYTFTSGLEQDSE